MNVWVRVLSRTSMIGPIYILDWHSTLTKFTGLNVSPSASVSPADLRVRVWGIWERMSPWRSW
jgi:hypothetical protein